MDLSPLFYALNDFSYGSLFIPLLFSFTLSFGAVYAFDIGIRKT